MFGKNNIDSEVKLEPQNGNKHIILIHTGISNGNKPEEIYTNKINGIIENIQNKGYEILDVRLEIGGTQGLSYETLIVYK